MRVGFLLVLLLCCLVEAEGQVPQMLHYQGQVLAGATPFEGVGKFKFALMDGASTTSYWSNDGTSAGGEEPGAGVTLPVSKGLYSVLLGDTALGNMTALPATVFTHPDVRLRVWFDDGVHGSQQLSPDQRIVAVGYAMMSSTVADGAITSAKLAANAVSAGSIAPASIGASNIKPDAVVKSFNGLRDNVELKAGDNVSLQKQDNAILISAGAGAGWGLSGNSALAKGSFLGTSDLESLEFRVNGSRALKLEPTGTDSPNLLAGAYVNSIDPGLSGANILGGGSTNLLGSSSPNHIAADFSTITGGSLNSIEAGANHSIIGSGRGNAVGSGFYQSVIAGGQDNQVSGGHHGVIGGGEQNSVTGNHGTVGGGLQNEASGQSVVGGGVGNKATAGLSTVAGGDSNEASGVESTVGGGNQNKAVNDRDTVGGGINNTASGVISTVAGGWLNSATGNAAVIAGGSHNSADGGISFIGGGSINTNSADHGTIGGGYQNFASGLVPAIGGGRENQAFADYATIAGGATNSAGGAGAFIGGGFGNTNMGYVGTISGGLVNTIDGNATYASILGGAVNKIGPAGLAATVGGGIGNVGSGIAATVPGGTGNEASGGASFAAGARAKATHDYSFVWAGGNDADFPSEAAGRFHVYASQGFQVEYGGQKSNGRGNHWVIIGSATDPSKTINTDSGAYLSAGGVWQNASDRARKTDVERVNAKEVLEKVAQLPISSWRYTNEATQVRHLGPMAQDFRRAFALGSDEKSIGTVDADGVALSAIQALYALVKEKDAQIEQMAGRLRELERRVEENQNSRQADDDAPAGAAQFAERTALPSQISR